MEPATLLFLSAAVLIAGMLQAATGIGFGLIGGPALLTTVAPFDALITASVLSAGIALVLVPKFRHHISWPEFRRLCLGGLAGLPVGALIFATADAAALKAGAALVVAFALAMLLFPVKTGAASAPKTGLAAGAICGVLGVCLSMPGPVAAAYLLRQGHSKTVVRATILAYFLPAYCATLFSQAVLAGVADTDWSIALWLAPATLVGVIAGQRLSARLSERTFRLSLQIVLAATIVSLVYSALADVM